MSREEEYLNYVFLKFLEREFTLNFIDKFIDKNNILGQALAGIIIKEVDKSIKEIETMHVYYPEDKPVPVKN